MKRLERVTREGDRPSQQGQQRKRRQGSDESSGERFEDEQGPHIDVRA